MESFWTASFGILAAAWIIGGLRMARGMARVPRLGEVSPLPDADCPAVSILVPARNEAAKLPQALPTLLAQDYPRSVSRVRAAGNHWFSRLVSMACASQPIPQKLT